MAAERACYAWPPVIFIYTCTSILYIVCLIMAMLKEEVLGRRSTFLFFFLSSSIVARGRYSVTTCPCLLATDTRHVREYGTRKRNKWETENPGISFFFLMYQRRLLFPWCTRRHHRDGNKTDSSNEQKNVEGDKRHKPKKKKHMGSLTFWVSSRMHRDGGYVGADVEDYRKLGCDSSLFFSRPDLCYPAFLSSPLMLGHYVITDRRR